MQLVPKTGNFWGDFLSDPRFTYGYGCQSVSLKCFVDLTDVTLADEDTNYILTDNANWAIQGNVAMQVVVAQFAIDASSSTWWPKFMRCHLVAKLSTCKWPNLEPIQMMLIFLTDPSGDIWWPNDN